jgi:hypothetical protein
MVMREHLLALFRLDKASDKASDKDIPEFFRAVRP